MTIYAQNPKMIAVVAIGAILLLAGCAGRPGVSANPETAPTPTSTVSPSPSSSEVAAGDLLECDALLGEDLVSEYQEQGATIDTDQVTAAVADEPGTFLFHFLDGGRICRVTVKDEIVAGFAYMPNDDPAEEELIKKEIIEYGAKQVEDEYDHYSIEDPSIDYAFLDRFTAYSLDHSSSEKLLPALVKNIKRLEK